MQHDTEKTAPTDAMNKLEALEGPARRAKHSIHALDTMARTPLSDHPKLAAAQKEAHEDAKGEFVEAHAALAAHEAQHGGSRLLHRKIDEAAQVVLDERGHVTAPETSA